MGAFGLNPHVPMCASVLKAEVFGFRSELDLELAGYNPANIGVVKERNMGHSPGAV
jgi:hypothetical protein